jgi:hypothetical protein
MLFNRQLISIPGLLLASIATTILDAQTIRGQLIDAVTSRTIDRAFVVLQDSNTTEVARVITDSRGSFSLRAPGPGTYVLRTERIGFGSTAIEIRAVGAAEVRDVSIRVNPIVVRLDSITVTGDAKECRAHREQGFATAIVWEEARKVLAAVAWGESQRHFTYHTR